jgi:hypothetical protein
MLKFAICIGISYEWVYGPEVLSWQSLSSAAVRAMLASLAVWMVLEALQAAYRAVMLLDDRPPRRIDPRPTVIGK